ncbi:MAG: hypothetical protein K1X89_03790 [Myxococcaceae bacterium]|nr:hypothetical protein [Myxococcaceae bacterium]
MRLLNTVARFAAAVADPKVPTDGQIKRYIKANESQLAFSKDGPPEAGRAQFERTDFSFYLRGNTPFYVNVDKQQGVALVQRNWTDGGEMAAVKLEDVVNWS